MAIDYSDPSTAGSIFEIEFDAASRGADVLWASQYPGEKELLYPPCTYLTCESVVQPAETGGIRLLKVKASMLRDGGAWMSDGRAMDER